MVQIVLFTSHHMTPKLFSARAVSGPRYGDTADDGLTLFIFAVRRVLRDSGRANGFSLSCGEAS